MVFCCWTQWRAPHYVSAIILLSCTNERKRREKEVFKFFFVSFLHFDKPVCHSEFFFKKCPVRALMTLKKTMGFLNLTI